jgi:hypothetical protein
VFTGSPRREAAEEELGAAAGLERDGGRVFGHDEDGLHDELPSIEADAVAPQYRTATLSAARGIPPLAGGAARSGIALRSS